MKTTMSVKEVMEILKVRAIAYVESLNPYEKQELARSYKKKAKLTNGIFLGVFSLLVAVCLTVANLLPEIWGVEIAFAIPFAILGVFFLGLAIYSRMQMTKIDKMSDDEAMLNGALKYIQKNTPMQELRAIVTGDVSIAGASVPSTPTNQPNATIGSDSVAPATATSESVSGKESEGEGEKLEGELTRQKLSIEGKSTAEILTELKSLYEEGLITEADYERKKAEILAKM